MKRKMKFPKWESISKDEQEVIIRIDYKEEQVIVYIRKKSPAYKLYKKVGEATETNLDKGEVYAMEWKIPFSDTKSISKAFAFRNYIDKSIS